MSMYEYSTPFDLKNKISGVKNRNVSDVVLVVLIALLAVLLFLQTFVFTTVFVSGGSMNDTLSDGDFLIADTIKGKTGNFGYGDIVIVDTYIPADVGQSKKIIKRVIGLGGDVIDLKGGRVYRNGLPIDEPYTDQITYVIEDGTNTEFPHKVGEDEVFVLGDNRSVSIDSRKKIYSALKKSQVTAVVPEWAVRRKDVIKKYYSFLFSVRGSLSGD